MLERGGSAQWGTVLGLLVLAGCDAPREGQVCPSSTSPRCASATVELECAHGRWTAVPCGGPTGCAESSVGARCDTSVVTLGAACPSATEGQRRCAGPPTVVAECRAGAWINVQRCAGDCATDGGAAACLPPAPCGPATCAGCCAQGTCVPPPANTLPGTCGSGGAQCHVCGLHEACGDAGACVAVATTCDISTCTTCCTANVCMAPSDTSCGILGRGCDDCTSVDQVCDRLAGRCVPPPSDGGADPCGGVPASGACLDAGVLELCEVATGQALPSLVTYACPQGTACAATRTGASCAPTGACLPGQSRCTSASLLSTCDGTGRWVATSCARGCRDGPIGGYCQAGPTAPFSGTLSFDRRRPNANYSGWSSAVAEPAAGVLVVAQSSTGSWYGVAETDAAGHYDVDGPALPAGSDALLFIAWGGDGLGVASAAMDPDLGAGLFFTGARAFSRHTWSWSRSFVTTPTGGSITITESQGSPALAVFVDLQKARAYDAAKHQGRPGRSVVAWFGLGTRWGCGTCFSAVPGDGFQTQVFIDGDTTDQGYWSDAVTTHELGHWAMASFGTSPGEGGPHSLGVPTLPGQAWSEGFATFHSSAVRANPLYFDDQGGMFWLDLSTLRDSGGGVFVPPTPDAGMLQRMDENALAAMLWRLGASDAGSEQRLHDALASPHLNTSPFPRGYTRHTWSLCWLTGWRLEPCDVRDTYEPAPMLADFLDALACGGLGAAALDDAVRPSTGYPYASGAPLCEASLCYGCSGDGGCAPGTSDVACGTAGVACAACVAGHTCAGGACR